MRVITVTEAGHVTELGELSEVKVIELAVLHMAVSDHENSFITATTDAVWLTVTLRPSQERCTVVYIIDNPASDVNIAATLMRTYKLTVREARRGALPEAAAVYLT